jgi:sulfatase maturation enzyme AslB (radical SAM superfamily)
MLEKSFCSSPWFHLRLSYDGNFEKCRWLKEVKHTDNIERVSILTYYNSDQMRDFRMSFLNGESPKECDTCYYQEQFGKLSGRQKQLLKSAIRTDDFLNSFKSSPHYDQFTYSKTLSGFSARHPTDLQIDLGNLCNSACIMCEPRASSKLVQDYTKLHQVSTLFEAPQAYKSWSANPELLDSFLQDLERVKDLKYIHLLGGETLYNDAFYKICEQLIATGQSKTVIVGTTTNGTIYTDQLAKLIPQFKQFHLGISIESITELNDYIRYPSDIKTILSNIDKFVALREQYPDLYLTLRITPNVFSVSELDQLFEYMIEKRITAEACNILHKPECLRMEVMPESIRQETIAKLEQLVNKHHLVKHNVANIRNPVYIDQVTADTVIEYLEFLKGYTVPDNVNELRTQLVEFLKSFESIRNNSILDYAPKYKDFLRHAGY